MKFSFKNTQSNIQSNILLNIFLVCFFLSCFLSCSSLPTSSEETSSLEKELQQKTKKGHWEAKAQIKDLKKNKTHVVNFDIISEKFEKSEKLRMDISGTLGIPLSSLAIQEQNIGYLIYSQKKYFYGLLNDNSLSPLFSVSINPRFLFNVCFDEAFSEKDWTCQINKESKLIESCRNNDKDLSIDWTERQGPKKRVTLKSKNFEIQILFKTYTTKVQSKENIYTLSVPESYSKIEISE